jgi:DNA-binding response OmpR family regulator
LDFPGSRAIIAKAEKERHQHHPGGAAAVPECLIIAEDCQDLLATLVRALAAENRVVPVCRAGDIFAELEENQDTRAILLDLGFTDGMDGFDALALLRRDYPKVPVLAMSASWDEALVRGTATRLGAARYYRKPIVLTELRKDLRRLFDTSQERPK